jgi:hypothetical protein
VLILSILPIVFLNVRLQGHTHIRSTNEKSTISGQFVVTRAHASATLASRSRSSARFEQANVWCPFTISRTCPRSSTTCQAAPGRPHQGGCSHTLLAGRRLAGAPAGPT